MPKPDRQRNPVTVSRELYFEQTGSGEPAFVFLHYFGGSSNTWKEVITRIKNASCCIAIDLPGFGASAALKEKATVENVALKVEELIKHLALRSYVLVGHSMGGKITLALAARAGAGLKKIVLVAPSPPTPEPADDAKRDTLIKALGNRKTLEKLARSLVAKPLGNAVLEELVEDNLRISHAAWVDWIMTGSKEDISGRLMHITVPVTVISGSDDPDFSTAFLKKEVSRWLPEATFIEVADAGHLLPVEQPDAIAEILKTVIKA